MSKLTSERLKALRKEKALTQKQVAEQIGIGRNTLSKYENPTDTSHMPLDVLRLLSKFYDCDPRYITGDIECKSESATDIHEVTGLSQKAIDRLKEEVKRAHDIQDSLIRNTQKETQSEIDYFVQEKNDRFNEIDKSNLSDELKGWFKFYFEGEYDNWILHIKEMPPCTSELSDCFSLRMRFINYMIENLDDSFDALLNEYQHHNYMHLNKKSYETMACIRSTEQEIEYQLATLVKEFGHEITIDAIRKGTNDNVEKA